MEDINIEYIKSKKIVIKEKIEKMKYKVKSK